MKNTRLFSQFIFIVFLVTEFKWVRVISSQISIAKNVITYGLALVTDLFIFYAFSKMRSLHSTGALLNTKFQSLNETGRTSNIFHNNRDS
ncbi:hypothetical protein BH11BAC3_BH11BAC3_24210 [soil metagenome]